MARKPRAKSQHEIDNEVGQNLEWDRQRHIDEGWKALPEEEKTSENWSKLADEAQTELMRKWHEHKGIKANPNLSSKQMGNIGTDARVSSESDETPGLRCQGGCGERFFTFGERDTHHTEAHPNT
jgi:hypothetical protein